MLILIHQVAMVYGNFIRVYQEPKEAQTLGSVEEFGWDGWNGLYLTVNPSENLTIVMMLQRGGYTDSALKSGFDKRNKKYCLFYSVISRDVLFCSTSHFIQFLFLIIKQDETASCFTCHE